MPRAFNKLSRPSMRALQPGERLNEFGITFERLANGDGLFSVNVMVDGKRIHRNLGRESEGVTRTTAEEFLAKIRQDAREGRLNLPKGRKVPLTLAAAVPAYLERLRQEGGKEIDRKRQRLEQCIVPFLGEQQLGQISSFDIERYKKHRLGETVRSRKKFTPGEKIPTNKPATVNRELATLSHLLNKAAYTDEAGHAFQYEAGHLFRSEAGHRTDLMAATLDEAHAGRMGRSFAWFRGSSVVVDRG